MTQCRELVHCFGWHWWHWGFYLTMTEICCPNMIYLHRITQTFPTTPWPYAFLWRGRAQNQINNCMNERAIARHLSHINVRYVVKINYIYFQKGQIRASNNAHYKQSCFRCLAVLAVLADLHKSYIIVWQAAGALNTESQTNFNSEHYSFRSGSGTHICVMISGRVTHSHKMLMAKQNSACRFLCFWEMVLISNYPLTNAMYSNLVAWDTDSRAGIFSGNNLDAYDVFLTCEH